MFYGLLHRHTSVGQPAKTYIYQLWVDTGFRLEDLPKVMADRDKWQERVKKICVVSIQWWWNNEHKTRNFLKS